MTDEQFDPRRETLVMETRTLWDPDVPLLSAVDRERIAHALHHDARHARRLHYERSHTGFIREITVTVADIDRLRAASGTGTV